MNIELTPEQTSEIVRQNLIDFYVSCEDLEYWEQEALVTVIELYSTPSEYNMFFAKYVRT